MSEYSRRGSQMLGLDLHDGQIGLGLVLDDRIETTCVLWPRRGGKTEGISSWLLGLCELEAGTNVIMTGQSGVKARERFMGMVRRLERYYPQEDGGPKVRRAMGSESLDFANGSRLWIAPPDPDSFRGDAADVVWCDEGQSDTFLKKGEDLQQAIYPLFDTVEAGMVILSGTAPGFRAGWFWESLERAREGTDGYAIDEYRLPDHMDPEDEVNWWQVHPGLMHGLTTIAKMRNRRARMSLAAWRMEYMSQTPLDFSNKALDTSAWAAGAAAFQVRPDHFALGYDIAPDNSSAAVVAAWRNDEGKACVEVVREDSGSTWVAPFLAQMRKKYRCPIGYDKVTANFEPATALASARPPIPAIGVPLPTTAGAEARLDSMIRKGEVEHYDQPALNNAVDGASWRDLSDSGRVWGRRSSEHEVAPLVAAAVAIQIYDTTPVASKPKIMRATA